MRLKGKALRVREVRQVLLQALSKEIDDGRPEMPLLRGTYRGLNKDYFPVFEGDYLGQTLPGAD